jgi:hypothetical protein
MLSEPYVYVLALTDRLDEVLSKLTAVFTDSKQ